MEQLIEQATHHLKDVLSMAIEVKPAEQAYVIFDTEAPLTRILTEAYRRALPDGIFIEFGTTTPAEILSLFDRCHANDLVILVQSTNFRLDAFRLRIELFKRNLKTIEHVHLARMSEEQFPVYIRSLAYDPTYYRPLGAALKERLDRAARVVVECQGTELVYDTALEETKLNVGDYSLLKNVGGLFPIGEVFTEAKDLTKVNGTARVFGFAGMDHVMCLFEPFIVHIEHGVLTAPDSPPEFQQILALIREDEEVLVRELGLGLNPAMGKHRIVNDVSAFERQKGLHLSLGAKHATYAKPGLKRKEGRYHVDIFIDAQRILVDGQAIYQDGEYTS